MKAQMRRWLLLGAAVAMFAACSRKDPATAFSTEDIAIAHAEAVDGLYERVYMQPARPIKETEPDAVPETVAQSLLSQLARQGEREKVLGEALRECSALHAASIKPPKTACGDEYNEPTGDCLRKEGHGQKAIGQILAAKRFDLNDDGIADYVMADRYSCNALSANQSNVYFVMLSENQNHNQNHNQNDNRNNNQNNSQRAFHLAYADWAVSDLLVVRDPSTHKLLLVEKSSKLYGTRTAIFSIQGHKMVERTCLSEDDNGFSACSPH